MEEFSKPQYAVDVLKVEVPVNMAFVKGARSSKGESVYTREEAKEHFRRAASMAKKPFIYLSAGVSNDTFNETLELAAEAGTNFSGVLCGRATWKDGIPVYAKQGLKAFEEWLSKQGVANINNVNQRLGGGQALVQLLRRRLRHRAELSRDKRFKRRAAAFSAASGGCPVRFVVPRALTLTSVILRTSVIPSPPSAARSATDFLIGRRGICLGLWCSDALQLRRKRGIVVSPQRIASLIER